MGRDDTDTVERKDVAKVSTHAPAWGATKASAPTVIRRRVSTHAPAWGATYHRNNASNI